MTKKEKHLDVKVWATPFLEKLLNARPAKLKPVHCTLESSLLAFRKTIVAMVA